MNAKFFCGSCTKEKPIAGRVKVFNKAGIQTRWKCADCAAMNGFVVKKKASA